MPHYPFPDFIGRDARITNFQGERCIQYVVGGSNWTAAKNAGAKRFMTDAFLPLDSISLRPKVCPSDVEIYRIDSSLRIYWVRERKRRYENMSFPPGTWALVLDTNKPIEQNFADDFCAYCTGLIGMKSKCFWTDKFFNEMKVGNEPTPYAKYAKLIIEEGKLYPSSPWPTPGYSSNGLLSIVNNKTRELLHSARVITKEALMTDYQWPARMSVAIFFNKKFGTDSLLYSILEARAKNLLTKYPNTNPAVSYQQHVITNISWVDTKRLAEWNEYDTEEETPIVKKKREKHKHLESYGTYWDITPGPVTKPRKVKIEIEDISTSTYDL